MSDSTAPNHDDHWLRLAADLGLDAGPESEQFAAADRIESRPEEPRHERVEDDDAGAALSSGRGRRKRSSPPPVDRPVENFGEGLRPTEFEEPPQGDSAFTREALFPDADELESNSPRELELATDEPPQSDAGPNEETEGAEQPEKRRRRRRSRRKKTGAAETESTEGGVGATADRANDEKSNDTDDEPAEDLSKNWNVPSWDELISSLYRPER